MLTRIRIALGLALSLMLLLTTPALAKGNFAFIGISTPGMTFEARTADRNLTMDWFAFANFPGGSIPAPATLPEGGYVITRYYMDGAWAVAFDQLHYYPAAGLVFYDGIKGGWSDYDRKWYAARPEIRQKFEYALAQEEARHVAVIRRS